MTDPFGVSSSTGPQFSSAGPAPQAGVALLQQLGLQPQQIAMLRQRMMGLPADQHAAFLRQNLMAIPGVREKLASIQNPQNQNVQPIGPPPSMDAQSMSVPPMQAGPSGANDPYAIGSANVGPDVPQTFVPPMQSPDPNVLMRPIPGYQAAPPPSNTGPMDQAPPPIGAPAVLPPVGSPPQQPNVSPGRAKHGKGLAPGQMKKMNIPGMQASAAAAYGLPGQVPVGGGRAGMPRAPRSMPIGGAQAGPDLGAMQDSARAAYMGAGISGGGSNDYRLRRMTGQGRGTAY